MLVVNSISFILMSTSMDYDTKRGQLDTGSRAVDRISNLPVNLKDLILERLPLHDAARTAVLSKSWSSVWEMHPVLVFDYVFFSRMVSGIDEQAQVSNVSKTISNILLLHDGSVSTLQIPFFCSFRVSSS